MLEPELPAAPVPSTRCKRASTAAGSAGIGTAAGAWLPSCAHDRSRERSPRSGRARQAAHTAAALAASVWVRQLKMRASSGGEKRTLRRAASSDGGTAGLASLGATTAVAVAGAGAPARGGAANDDAACSSPGRGTDPATPVGAGAPDGCAACIGGSEQARASCGAAEPAGAAAPAAPPAPALGTLSSEETAGRCPTKAAVEPAAEVPEPAEGGTPGTTAAAAAQALRRSMSLRKARRKRAAAATVESGPAPPARAAAALIPLVALARPAA